VTRPIGASALALIATLALLARAAHGGPLVAIEDRANAYALALPAGWVAIDAPGTLRAHRSADGVVLVVTRLEAGGRALGDAAALADALERGVARETPGYRREARAQRTIGYAAVIDLVYRRGGAERVTTRFVVLRSRTLIVTIAAPADASRATRRAIADAAKSFVPLLESTSG
jgi:hypothetical protein